MHPQVEDAGGGDDGRRRLEQVTQRAEHVAADVGDPERGVPELLELGGGVAPLVLLAVAQLAAPDADPVEFHCAIVIERTRFRQAAFRRPDP
jgi:hypothetical protein